MRRGGWREGVLPAGFESDSGGFSPPFTSSFLSPLFSLLVE